MTLREMIQFEKEESYDEGVAEGIEQGIGMGIQQGITIYISSLREYNIAEEQIRDSVVQKFGIPKEKAMELMVQSNN